MSSARLQVEQYVEPDNEWTIMVFFAGDPHLSPSMTAQLKSLKDAGFQDHTTVLVHYDPNEKGVATTTFEINRKRKADLRECLKKNNPKNESATRIGDGKNPFVRNLLDDSIPNGASRPDNAEEALRAFLDIGAKDYPAKHYIICFVGHGVIVGNDAFLPDSSPQSAITLQQLGQRLRHFAGSIPEDAVIELVGMHSCSMSAIEVLYELRGVARYMMATEGISFVTSWPYRQLLKKILNAIDVTTSNKAKEKGTPELNVDKLITSVQELSLHNSTDFIFSGLSSDISLCRLDKERVEALNEPLAKLAEALKDGLEKPPKDPRDPEYPPKESRGAELIKLAHLEAQSYWQETYTDLYDFCLCLERRCDKNDPIQKAMAEACDDVKLKLEEGPDSLIVQSDHYGPLFQYSHGLSIFFPWSQPMQENRAPLSDDILARYESYEFTKELGRESWLSFLKKYFMETKRASRDKEDKARNAKLPAISDNGNHPDTNADTTIAATPAAIGTTNIGNGESLAPEKASGALAPEKASGALEKASGALSAGCGCSVKNYPMEFSPSPRATQDANPDATKKEEMLYVCQDLPTTTTDKPPKRGGAKTNARNKTR